MENRTSGVTRQGDTHLKTRSKDKRNRHGEGEGHRCGAPNDGKPRRRGRDDGGQITVIKETEEALAGVAQWTECQPVDQRVAGSIPSQGTCLGRRPGPL